jgi:predicted TIM-barrel fold metal-dependent hydrolase
MSELNRRKAIVFVHPASVPEDRAPPGIKSHILEGPFDTTRTIMSLLINGVLSRCPAIRFIFAHGGGAIPYLAGRVASLFDRSGDMESRQIQDQLAGLYFDTALTMNEPALAALTTFASQSRILLGTDSPILSAEAEIGAWQSVRLDPHLRRVIEHDNAAALLRRVH